MKHKLEQTAVKRPSSESPLEGNSSPIRIGPQLHLSIEHAAIAQMLTEDELDLVLCLGRGLDAKKLAERYGLTVHGAYYRLEALSEKTRMSRLSLAVLGYNLSGQPEYQDVAA